MRFASIHAMVAEKAPFGIAPMCRVLDVTRQGYYAYRRSIDSPRLAKEVALRERVAKIHVDSGGTYGSPRIVEQLRRDGAPASKRRVERVMRAAGIVGTPRGRHKTTTRANPAHPVEPNVLDRDFTASRPDERWVTDITYIWTDEGWCYLAAILDLFSRSVVGWQLSRSLSTELPLDALNRALLRRRPDGRLLHHSDRGCQYTSADYRRELAANGITVSMSRRGNCWDNAVAESFFATLKTELVYRRSWKTRLELRNALFEYIETFYNRRRLHSSLNYRTPAEVEAAYKKAA
jgi:transposase InsO family protein